MIESQLLKSSYRFSHDPVERGEKEKARLTSAAAEELRGQPAFQWLAKIALFICVS